MARLRAAGVEEITLRLDKGFFSREIVAALQALGVSYMLKVPDQRWVRSRLAAHVLTNLDGIHALSAWRLYNQGALVERRIEELGQLSVGTTAVDDLGGNHLLWALEALAYQMLPTIRTTALSGSWRAAQTKRLRPWLFRLPAKLTTHARKQYVQLQRAEPWRRELLRALRRVGTGPPLPT